ncbi:MAG: OsmC family protein [Deltaproteobacteria bacterium]|nr:OsmC family protein [Deltaproteobacteria bacterium]
MQVEAQVAYAAGMTHDYHLELVWTGNTGAGTTDYARYSREYRVTAVGKPDLVGSADPAFRGDRHRYNPEDLLVAALAACHMLSYLALCARNGIAVQSYTDACEGRMRLAGGGQFESVTLRPRVGISAGDRARAIALHRDAHDACFIARSCNFPITCEPEVTPAPAPAPAPVRQDLAVRLPHRPGALAAMGEALGAAGISLEGGGGFAIGDTCVVHFLVAEAERAAEILRAAGFEVLGVRDVIAQRLDQGTPGQLGQLARALADAGVNIASVYSDHDHALILGVDDREAAQRAAARWARGA